MKKLGFILIACALIMGTAQCKKNDETNKPENGGESVFITLYVGGGTRADVVPEEDIAPVYYEEGDMIHVVSDGKYIGTLTYDGSVFGGDITYPTENQPLHFYFLGNVTPTESLEVGETTTCSVVISDQTTSHPVISYAPSTQYYSTGVTNYAATLLNKCALVKFDVTTLLAMATCITGVKNKVTVDFGTNDFAYDQEGEGVITMSAGSGEKWVILLPQEEVTQAKARSADGMFAGSCANIPAVSENDYLKDGIAVAITHPTGAINSLFTVNANGDQVYFSQGNLMYSNGIWMFHENQYDRCFTSNVNVSSYYNASGTFDLFGWGTSGYNHGAINYQPWSTIYNTSNYYAYGSYTYNLYDQDGRAEWGYNAITNGGNTENSGWRTLTMDEWKYVFSTRNTVSGKRYARAKVNGLNGIILLPDDWEENIFNLNNGYYDSNTISAVDWTNILEANGAVFIPATGARYGTSLSYVGYDGYYWSASYRPGDSYYARSVAFFDEGGVSPIYNFYRCAGLSVRLVRDAE